MTETRGEDKRPWGIIGAGAMGASLAERIVASGGAILVLAEGRSEASLARVKASGAMAGGWGELAQTRAVLSVVPPAAAMGVASEFAKRTGGATQRPPFADMNAISPEQVRRIAGLIAGADGVFADGGIVGAPPSPGGPSPRLYICGPGAGAFSGLTHLGLDVRLLSADLGGASALKMAYAGFTKGFMALASTMILAADRAGVAHPLRAEMGASQASMVAWLSKALPDMFPKAHRFVDELDEIGAFVGAARDESLMLTAAARLYETLATSFEGDAAEIDAIKSFLTGASGAAE